MTTTRHQTTRLSDLAQLRPGDTVEARRYDTVLYRGQVDDVVAHLGILWLRHGPWQERLLLDAAEYDLWTVTTATQRPARMPSQKASIVPVRGW